MSSSVVPAKNHQVEQNLHLQKTLPLGQLLLGAGLISKDQLKLALQNQAIPRYEKFKIGEVLALRGWIKQETCDFFATRWRAILKEEKDDVRLKKISNYLVEAHLLTQEQIQAIAEIQRQKQKSFGQIAIEQGLLKQQTITFLVEQLSTVPSQSASKLATLIERAERYFRLHDLSGAILELREVLRRDSDHATAHAWLTRIYLQRGQHSLAKVHLKKAIATAPDDAFVKETKKCFFASIPSQQKGKKSQGRSNKQSSQRSSWLKFG